MLGDYVKEMRISRGLSQRELARLAGITGAYISQIESGEVKNPSMTTIKNIARALKVSLNDISKQTTNNDMPIRERDPHEVIRELDASLPACIPIHDALNSKKIISYVYVPKVLIKGGKMHGLVSPVAFEDIIRKGDILLCSEEITPQAGDVVIYSNGTDTIAKYSKKLEKVACCVIVQSVRNFRDGT